MSYQTKVLGTVDNPEALYKEVSIPGMTLVLGGAAIGTYVGLQVGGGAGAAVGALIGAFVGSLAAGYIKRCKVVLHSDGTVEVEYETRF